ncbi:MAG: MoxR family ATPase [Opitutales bacterium]|nr:MoxR family ATPase [Opitutales bacterium]
MPVDTTPTPLPPEIENELETFRQRFLHLEAEVAKIMVGQEDIVRNTLTAILAGGHVLLEGVPGLGKTLLVKTISEALDLNFGRVQFTPDVMPADLIGTKMFVDEGPGKSRFEFSRGPLFTNLLLGDEINRASPKTQSALLEAMQERAVTVGGETHILEAPFFVLATQNPLEQEGTYPLPEAQLDRFLFKLEVPYPSFDEFDNILERTTGEAATTLTPVFDGHELTRMSRLARKIPVPPTVRRRVVELIMATHPETEFATDEVKKWVRFGASPRAGQACLLAAKIRAIREGRVYVATEDILAYAVPILNHRVLLNFEAQADGVSTTHILKNLINTKKDQWKNA